MNKTQLLDKLTSNSEDRILLARVMDQMAVAQNRNVPAHTPFLSPHEQSLVHRLIASSGYPRAVFLGGYPDAERRICLFLPDWMEEEDADCPELCAIRATWKDGRNLTHRDFLGALMGMGISREKLGDILVGEGTCDFILLEEICQFLLQSMDSAGRSRLTLSRISLDEIQVPVLRVKTIHDTVATLRLDAVCAAGFSTSRSRISELISSGKVSLNGQECLKPDAAVEEGDTISCRGMGKCRLTQVEGVSRKGRTIIQIDRYL